MKSFTSKICIATVLVMSMDLLVFGFPVGESSNLTEDKNGSGIFKDLKTKENKDSNLIYKFGYMGQGFGGGFGGSISPFGASFGGSHGASQSNFFPSPYGFPYGGGSFGGPFGGPFGSPYGGFGPFGAPYGGFPRPFGFGNPMFGFYRAG